MPSNDTSQILAHLKYRSGETTRVGRRKASPTFIRWLGIIALSISHAFTIGCGRDQQASIESVDQPDASLEVAADPPEKPIITAGVGAALRNESLSNQPLSNQSLGRQSLGQSSSSGSPASVQTQAPVDASSSNQRRQGDADARRLQLRPDLTIAEMQNLLGEIDREMRALINGQSGINDPDALTSEVRRVVNLKRIASERLMNDPAADESARVKGCRGYLQAMSHLASMGDLASAEELQVFADRFRNDPNPELRSDSQLVLIGFAVERLRHGKENAAAEVLDLTKSIAADGSDVDVATLMVMGQAKDTLLQYEQPEAAAVVRDLILQRFAGADDPEVARMAAMIAASGFAGNDEDLQRLDSLRTAIVQPEAGRNVTAEVWTAAVEKVLGKDVDLLTVQFLAGMSLEAEAIGRNDIAAATYQLLSAEIADREDAIGREARTAIEAKANREAVIGQKFVPDLPSVDGQALSITDYEGKVVLVPFWSSAFPDSLGVLPNLQAIQAKHPNQISIVGINLDLAGTDAEGFMTQNDLSFKSFRSVSDPSADITNEVAYRFGAVSLVFVAVLDQAGRVAFVDFSGMDLTEKIENLLR